MLNRRIKFLLIIIILFFLFNNPSQIINGTKSNNQQNSDLKVITSLSMIEDWAQHVAGNLFNVSSIVNGLENPHTYDPSPSEVAAVASADLFIRFGLSGLEPWVESVLQSSSPKTVLTLINVSNDEYMVLDTVINKKNPHVWMSPINAIDMTFKIYKKFLELNSANNVTFYQNFLSYEKDINSLLTRINQTKGTLNKTKVVVHHPAFLYFFDLLGLNRIGVIEEVEGAEPSAAHIAELTQKMIDEECDLIINQPQLDEKDVEALALSTDAKIAVLTPLLGVEVEDSLKPEFGLLIDNYIEMFDYNLYKLTHPYTPSTESTPGFVSISILSIIFITIILNISRKKKRAN